MCSGGFASPSRLSSAGTKSSATVQQMQPLDSSTIRSSAQLSMPPLLQDLSVDADSPNSLTITANRRPWHSEFVGARASFSRAEEAGDDRARHLTMQPRRCRFGGRRHESSGAGCSKPSGGTRAMTPLRNVAGRSPRYDAVLRAGYAIACRQLLVWIGIEVTDDVGPLAGSSECERAGALADGEAFDRPFDGEPSAQLRTRAF